MLNPGLLIGLFLPLNALAFFFTFDFLLCCSSEQTTDYKSAGAEAFLRIACNVRGYAQCGIAWLRLYHTIQTLPAGTTACKPLKPALGMSRCYAQFLFYKFLIISFYKLIWFPLFE
jgi:hypothetical protein